MRSAATSGTWSLISISWRIWALHILASRVREIVKNDLGDSEWRANFRSGDWRSPGFLVVHLGGSELIRMAGRLAIHSRHFRIHLLDRSEGGAV